MPSAVARRLHGITRRTTAQDEASYRGGASVRSQCLGLWGALERGHHLNRIVRNSKGLGASVS